jgi:predicted phosphate transport protein (TIGR00153 family)
MFGLPPKEDKFYQLFAQSTEIITKSLNRLEGIMQQNAVSTEDAAQMHRFEHEADGITTQILERLNSTFITPLDREDIYRLAQVLDDIVDFAEGTVERMLLYRTGKPSPGAQELVHLVFLATEQIRSAFRCLGNIHFKKSSILAAAEEIYHLESSGDKLYRQEVARLFEFEKDPIEIIKWKEILEHIETTLDHCESIADLLKSVVLKYD